jgi:hypothetical protein
MIQAYHYGRWGTATPQQSCTMDANGGLLFFGDRRTAVLDPSGRVIGFSSSTRTGSATVVSGSSGRTRR